MIRAADEYGRPLATHHVLEAGDTRLELSHARGETDDHTWLWWPARRTLFTGDLFFWVAPNAGNPQKVQRYAVEWAAALRAMAALGPELLLPGHGLPIAGAARVREALIDTATYLESLGIVPDLPGWRSMAAEQAVAVS